MRFSVNAPTVLTYTFLCIAAYFANSYLPSLSLVNTFLTGHPVVPGSLSLWSIIPSLLHIFGHTDINDLSHLLTFVLLLGPSVEDRFGSKRMLMFITLLDVITIASYSVMSYIGLLEWYAVYRGSVGLVCMLVVLQNFVGSSRVALDIPIESILAAVVFFAGQTNMTSMRANAMTAIIGGVTGLIFGVIFRRKMKND